LKPRGEQEVLEKREKMIEVFDSVPCFSKKDAEDIVAVVDMLEPYWARGSGGGGPRLDYTKRGVNFFTLGTSSWGEYSIANAHGRRALMTNELISKHLGKFYLKMFKALSDHFDVPVFSPPEVNVPGFHIFTGLENSPKGLEYEYGSMHRDATHIRMEFPFAYTDIITFTIMLEEPEKGSSMNYWDDEVVNKTIGGHAFGMSNRFRSIGKFMREQLTRTVKTFDYKIGELVIHDGQTIHQVANMVDTTPKDRRISLHGYGVLTDKGYIVYF
jgi:hypothetical protein